MSGLREFLSGSTPRWMTVVLVVILLLGFGWAFRSSDSEKTSRQAAVCLLAQAFVDEQVIAQTPSVPPPGADTALTQTIEARNKLRASALRSIRTRYAEVCS